MNYLKARQRQSDLRWDFTQMNDGRVWPIGYCGGFPKVNKYTVAAFGGQEQIDRWLATLEPFRDRFHTDGHATAEEAGECYRRYLLDHRLHLTVQHSSAHKCLVCSTWTDKSATVDGSNFPLCDEHRTREEVEARYGSVGEIICS